MRATNSSVGFTTRQAVPLMFFGGQKEHSVFGALEILQASRALYSSHFQPIISI